MSDALRARLTGPAARFIYLLRDFGHLDDASMAELILDIAGEADSAAEARVDLPTARRLAARHLFVRSGADLAAGEGILVEDWPLLFS